MIRFTSLLAALSLGACVLPPPSPGFGDNRFQTPVSVRLASGHDALIAACYENHMLMAPGLRACARSGPTCTVMALRGTPIDTADVRAICNTPSPVFYL